MYTGEWISGAVCMYVASFLVENYEQNERVSLVMSAVYIYVQCVFLMVSQSYMGYKQWLSVACQFSCYTHFTDIITMLLCNICVLLNT